MKWTEDQLLIVAEGDADEFPGRALDQQARDKGQGRQMAHQYPE